MISVGQQTDWHNETSIIQTTAPYVIKKKQSTTSSPLVSSPNDSGFPSCNSLG
jgi:hypothetical protein